MGTQIQQRATQQPVQGPMAGKLDPRHPLAQSQQQMPMQPSQPIGNPMQDPLMRQRILEALRMKLMGGQQQIQPQPGLNTGGPGLVGQALMGGNPQ